MSSLLTLWDADTVAIPFEIVHVLRFLQSGLVSDLVPSTDDTRRETRTLPASMTPKQHPIT